jgi:outer membrane biogenesis lipoprotein LolB
MFKNILKIIVLTISSLALFSCASSNEARTALSNKVDEPSQSAKNDNTDRMMTYSISLELSVKKTMKREKI